MASANPILSLGEKVAAGYDVQLAKVMESLSKRILAIASKARIGATDVYDATLFLNSFPEMIAALDAAGYNALSAEYLAQYKKVAPAIAKRYAGRGGPKPTLSSVSRELLRDMGRADFSRFAALGSQGIETLHYSMFKAMSSRQDFSAIVDMIRKATVGVEAKRGTMANYAYTHANTAFQQFSGQVVISTAESIGHGGPEDLWEVTGPEDEANRPECSDALANPIRTRAEWEEADYWGGAPGGWNCRHQLEPVFK